MIVLRLVFTVAVMAMVIGLLSTGRPLGGLVIVPILAIGLRRSVERYRAKATEKAMPATMQ